MRTWIRTYTKHHPSFAAAVLDREVVLRSLATEIGRPNVKARIRKRPSGFDLIVWRASAPQPIAMLGGVR